MLAEPVMRFHLRWFWMQVYLVVAGQMFRALRDGEVFPTLDAS